MGLRMVVTAVDYREEESTEAAVRSAAGQAFNRLLQEGDFFLLEPIHASRGCDSGRVSWEHSVRSEMRGGR